MTTNSVSVCRAFVAVISLALCLAACGQNAAPAGSTITHPDADTAQIEYFFERPDGEGPWPTVLFLHGHQAGSPSEGGAAFVRWGVLTRFSKMGYLAVSISLPGYGRSSGPPDFAGPFTQRAVEAVILKLQADRLADSNKILIQGTSLGAVTAALVATREAVHPAGLVLISGLYDLAAFLDPPKSAGAIEILAALVQQTGGGGDVLRSRSALPVASKIRATTLILNGAQDDRTDPDQAAAFADAIRAAGGSATAHVFPEYGHEIPVKARDGEIDAFIDGVLKR